MIRVGKKSKLEKNKDQERLYQKKAMLVSGKIKSDNKDKKTTVPREKF